MGEGYPPKRPGRPRVEVDYALVVWLREVKNLGWSRGAAEYRVRKEQFISRDTFKRRYKEAKARATESLEARIERVFEELGWKLKL